MTNTHASRKGGEKILYVPINTNNITPNITAFASNDPYAHSAALGCRQQQTVRKRRCQECTKPLAEHEVTFCQVCKAGPIRSASATLTNAPALRQWRQPPPRGGTDGRRSLPRSAPPAANRYAAPPHHRIGGPGRAPHCASASGYGSRAWVAVPAVGARLRGGPGAAPRGALARPPAATETGAVTGSSTPSSSTRRTSKQAAKRAAREEARLALEALDAGRSSWTSAGKELKLVTLAVIESMEEQDE